VRRENRERKRRERKERESVWEMKEKLGLQPIYTPQSVQFSWARPRVEPNRPQPVL